MVTAILYLLELGKNAQYLLREKSDFQTMEEEQKVLISMPSENNNRRSGVLPFDADSSHFVLSTPAGDASPC